MKDWKQFAAAVAPDIPPEQVDRLVATMEKLEASFRPLVEQIRIETEPAYIATVAARKNP